MKKKKSGTATTRDEELEALRAQVADLKKNPELGRQLLVKAGILTKEHKLAPYYKRKA